MTDWFTNLFYTLVALLALVVIVYVIHTAVRTKLKRVMEYGKLINIFYGIAILIFGLVLLYIWGVLPLILTFAGALGIIGIIFGFAIMEVWLSNVMAGVSIAFDKLLKVGCRIKIDGTKGEITQISLTSTKLRTDDGKLMVIPNKSFRQRPYLLLETPQKRKPARRR